MRWNPATDKTWLYGKKTKMTETTFNDLANENNDTMDRGNESRLNGEQHQYKVGWNLSEVGDTRTQTEDKADR